MKKNLIFACLVSFVVGFGTDRLIVRAEVKKMEAEVAAVVGKIWGYDVAEAKEFLGILGQQYSPEELTNLMKEVAEMGQNMEQLFYDERLVSTLRGLAYLKILNENNITELEEKITEQVTAFYEDYRHLLHEKPTNDQERTAIGVLEKIQSELEMPESEPVVESGSEGD